jgi:hypothetical protein
MQNTWNFKPTPINKETRDVLFQMTNQRAQQLYASCNMQHIRTESGRFLI